MPVLLQFTQSAFLGLALYKESLAIFKQHKVGHAVFIALYNFNYVPAKQLKMSDHFTL
jgi:hypothetical protein